MKGMGWKMHARVNAENIYATTFLITSYVITKNDTNCTMKGLASVSEIPNVPKIVSHPFGQFSV